MNDEEIEQALIDVMMRTLDGWLLLNPEITHNAVVEWLESVEQHSEQIEDLVLEGDASEIG